MHAKLLLASDFHGGCSYKTKSRVTIMPSGHYKKVIDPRTRAEVAPEVVPFWHLKIAAGKGQSSQHVKNEEYNQFYNKDEDAQKQENEKCCSANINLTKLFYLDGCSAVLSFAAGILAITMLNFQFHLWQEETVFVKATDPLISAHDAYEVAVTTSTGSPTDEAKSCLSGWELEKSCIDYTKLNEDTGVLVWSIPHTIKTNESLELMPMILFVVWFSAIVQGLRCYCSKISTFKYSNKLIYNPVKPDFWRWFEYACTSPLQIVLVGLSVMIGNWVQLLLLATLQLALIWFGFVIEKRINKLYKSEKASSSVKLLKVWILFGCAVYCHWVIWDILFFHVNSHNSNLKSCEVRHNKEGLPKVVWSVIEGQCACFTLFGFVQFVQLSFASFWYMKKRDSESCCDENEREKNWLKVTFAYSVLSVTAKLTLDVTLIYFVNMLKDVQCDHT